MRLYTTLLLTFILAMASCTKRQEALPFDGNADGCDSTTLSVAVLPTLSCLPVYYAQRMGMFDSAGVSVHLCRYQAQMDVDTAVLRDRVQVAISDPLRALRLQSDSLDIIPLMAMDAPLSLVALKGKRVKQMKQMKEKTVAISRLSCTDYWSQKLTADAGIDLSLIFRPQVNDIYLRTDMLRGGLLDAAMLPEPYATWTAMEGHRRVGRTKTPGLCTALWIMPQRGTQNDSLSSRVQRFDQVYRQAIKQMNDGLSPDTTRAILIREYALPPQVADSIQLPPVPEPRTLTAQETDEAAEWLHQQNRLPKQHSTPKFLSKQAR